MANTKTDMLSFPGQPVGGMRYFFTERAKPFGGLEAIAARYEFMSLYADGNDNEPSHIRMQIDGNVVAGWGVVCKTSETLDPDAIEINSDDVEEELQIYLFGQLILSLLVTQDMDPELLTCEGFYELVKDEEGKNPSLSTILAALIHSARQPLFENYNDELDELNIEGGPSYKFADWVLGARGEGEPFELKTK